MNLDHNIPFAVLNLPANPISDTYKFPIIKAGSRSYRHLILPPTDILNTKTIETIEKLGQKIFYVMLFYKRVGNNGKIHTDCHWYKDKWYPIVAGINYVLNDAQSKNTWYNSTNNNPQTMDINNLPEWLSATHSQDASTKLGFRYITGSNYFPELENTKADFETDVLMPTLFRTDKPHTTINSNEHDRWAISIRFDTWDNQLSWEEYLDIFSPIVIHQ